MITLASPWVLLLLPLPLFVYVLIPPRQVTQVSVRVPFFSRISSRESSKSNLVHRLQSLIPAFAIWSLALLALARPQWLEPPIERQIPTRDLLLIVDLSGSMQQEDFADQNGNPIDRLTALKEVVGEFLIRRQGDRVGLVVFGNSPFLQIPFSTDLNLSRQLLNETRVGMAGPKTALGDAIGLGIQLFEHSDVPEKTIIALTDGNDNSSGVPPTEAARIAKDRGITIHTIGMGDPTTVGEEKLDTETLKAVATSSGGESFLALDRDQLENVYQRLDKIETKIVKTEGYQPKRDLFYWPFALAFLLSIGQAAGRILQQVWDSRSHSSTGPNVTARLRVNAQTFELESSIHEPR